jgi:hypothetical protein
MKFFTRERYDAIQGDSAEAEKQWENAVRDYSRHVEQIRESLADAGRSLLGLTLHDGTIEKLERPSPTVLEIIVDATRNPWGTRARVCLTFSAVNPVTLQEPRLADWWLYEEVHLSTVGFALHVLLGRSELLVEATGLEIRSLTKGGLTHV